MKDKYQAFSKPLPDQQRSSVKAIKVDAGMTDSTPVEYRGWMIRTQAKGVVNTAKALAMNALGYNSEVVSEIQNLSPVDKQDLQVEDTAEWMDWERQNPSPYGASVEDSLKRFQAR